MLKRTIAFSLLLMVFACASGPDPLPTQPDAPTGLVAEAGDGEVRLSWQESAGATGYNVYRNENPNVEGRAANRRNATLRTANTFTDKEVINGRIYYYVVTAVGPGGESSPSDIVGATPSETPVTQPPLAPANLRASPGEGRVSLTWAASIGATGYNVYRSESSNVGIIAANRRNPVLLTTTTFTDEGVTNGKTYYYVVTAVSASGRESDKSNEVSAKPQDTPPHNQAPIVDAGPDKSITWPDNSVMLEGHASDDSLPDPPGELTTIWAKVSGPGTVTFEDASSPVTTASFSSVGSYVLRLTAHDGELTNGDETMVTVRESQDFTAINWTSLKPAPVKVAEALGAVVDGKLYVFSGYTSWSPVTTIADIHVYDPATDTWTKLAPMPQRLTHAGTAVDGRDIYIAGGYPGKEPSGQSFATTNVWKYNVDSQTWTAMPPLPEPRGAGALVRLERTLHFFGGSDEKRQDRAEHWTLNLAGGTAWQKAPPLPIARNHLGATVLDGKIYAIGGQQGQDARSVSSKLVNVWNPITAAWEEAATLPKALSHIANSITVMNGRIIVVGGEIAHTKAVADVWAYSPLQDKWTQLTSLPVPHQSTIAKAIGNQLIVTTGGARGFSNATYGGVPVR